MRGVRPNQIPLWATYDVRKEMKLLIPTPDPDILKKLISDVTGTNYGIRLPWQRGTNTQQYDQEKVEMFARILTMLYAMGIYPPAQLQSQGGSFPRVNATFDGPLQI